MVRNNNKMKYTKICLILLSFIIYSYCADSTCSTLKTESTCTANTACQWNAAKCSGGTGTTCSSKTVEADCEAEEYSGTINCEFTDESEEGQCAQAEGKTKDCSGGAASKTACVAISDCAWTPTDPAACEGHADCEKVKNPTQTTCEAVTYSGTANCKWSVAACGDKPSTPEPTPSSSFYMKFSCLIGLFFFLF